MEFTLKWASEELAEYNPAVDENRKVGMVLVEIFVIRYVLAFPKESLSICRSVRWWVRWSSVGPSFRMSHSHVLRK